MTDEGVRVRRGLVIPEAELRWRFDAAGRPGRPAREHGEHPRRAALRHRRLADARTPPAGPAARQGSGPRSGSSPPAERSQARNRAEARERLAARLADALAVEPTRVPTRSTKAAKERRLEAKRRQSRRKASRGRVTSDD